MSPHQAKKTFFRRLSRKFLLQPQGNIKRNILREKIISYEYNHEIFYGYKLVA